HFFLHDALPICDFRFLALLGFTTIVDYFIALKIDSVSEKSQKKKFLLVSLILNLGILSIFKYLDFFASSFTNFLHFFGLESNWTTINILLPVGISFYTFQSMSYCIDVYRGDLKAEKSFLNFALFVSFFPQLVAGPIERATNLLSQFRINIKFSFENFRTGMALITVGMFNKILIGDTSGRIVDQIFAAPQFYSSPELVMGLVLFAIQIYADFSGYSNIARGSAKLMGFNLMENFNQPYLSANITEFWRRWHISLSSWLKDYLYIPLGGNRKGIKRTYINLMLTMLLGGLWHGASWTFFIWGGLHGFYLAVHKYILKEKKPAESYTYNGFFSFTKFIFKVLATNILVLITWLFFRAKDFDSAFYFIKNIFVWTPSEFSSRIVSIIISFLIATFSLDIIEYITKDHSFLLKVKKPARYAIMLITWFFVLIYLFQMQPMPFIYFQF